MNNLLTYSHHLNNMISSLSVMSKQVKDIDERLKKLEKTQPIKKEDDIKLVIKQEIENELKTDTSKQTYPLSQYSQFAQKIENAGHDIGTDEASMFAVFRKIKTNKDLLLLKKAFGTRPYTGDILPYFVLRNDLDLQGWITSELSSSDVTKINTILRNNGVTYSF